MSKDEDMYRYMFGDPCEAAIRRETERTKNTAMKQAFQKAKRAREAIKQLFQEPQDETKHDERSNS